MGTAAEELRFELDRELIASDAEIKIRRLEAGRFRGAEQERALDRLIAAAAARERRLMAAVRRLERLAGIVQKMSLCGLGQGAPNPIFSTLRYFRDEYLAHIVDKTCPAGVCPISKPAEVVA